jgi:hypothetical protein
MEKETLMQISKKKMYNKGQAKNTYQTSPKFTTHHQVQTMKIESL